MTDRRHFRQGTRLAGAFALVLMVLFLWNQVAVPIHLATHEHTGTASAPRSIHGPHGTSDHHHHGDGHSHHAPPPAADEEPEPHDSDGHRPHSIADHIAALELATCEEHPGIPACLRLVAMEHGEPVFALHASDAPSPSSRGPPAARC